MKQLNRRSFCLGLPLLILSLLSACGGQNSSTSALLSDAPLSDAPLWTELSLEGELPLDYATQFRVLHYSHGYRLLTIGQEQTFLLVPEGSAIPLELPNNIVPLCQPLHSIYLAASSAMNHVLALNALDAVTLSSQKAENWYLAGARLAMEEGRLHYAGKYSAPDYECILSYGCDLALENTMIYHTPEVMEQLQRLGIPVVVERSSYEAEPLGRMEWLKFYGALLGRDQEAEQYFAQLTGQLNEILHDQPTQKTVVFFSLTANGAVTVRRANDYISRSIALAGGIPLTCSDESDTALSTQTIQMETFYSLAKDADCLIYNSTIEGEIETIDQLLAKEPLLADFKAVQNGMVWCGGRDLYQEPLGLSDFILDIHTVLTLPSAQEEALRFLHPVR